MLFSIVYWIAAAVCYIFYGVRYIGKENLPKGKCVICGNHTAIIDPVLVVIALGFRRSYRVIGKKEAFQNPFFAALLGFVGVFPVDRDAADIGAIKNGLKTLKDDQRLIIFPEGARVKKGVSLKTGEPPVPKNGAVMFALRGKAPIIPVFIPEGRKAFKRNVVVFGKPIYPEVEGKGTQAEMDVISLQVMETIQSLNPDKKAMPL